MEHDLAYSVSTLYKIYVHSNIDNIVSETAKIDKRKKKNRSISEQRKRETTQYLNTNSIF